MPSRRMLLVVAAWSVCGLLRAHGDERKSRLSPPEGAELASARGEVEIDGDEFEVKVKRLLADTEYGVFVDDGTGELVSIGSLTTDDEGEGELEFDDGQLPLDAMSADQLAGRAIEVRDAEGNVVLAGTTAAIRFRDEEREGETELQRPEPPVDEDAEGEIELKQRDGRIRVTVEVENLEPVTLYEVLLTDPETGDSESLGVITTKKNGEGKLRVDTGKGDPSPFGVGSVADLVGFQVAVNDPDGNTVLEGTIGSVNIRPREEREEEEQEGENCLVAADPESGAQGEVEIEVEEDGDEELKVKVKRLAPAAVFSVVLENPADASTASAGEFTTNDRGRGELRLKPSEGDALPFDAASVLDLVGFGVSVNDMDGNTVLSGTVPALDDDCEEEDEDEDEDEDDDEDDDDDDEDEDEQEGESCLTAVDPESGARGEVEIELEEKHGRFEEELEVEVEGLTPEAVFGVVLENPEDGSTASAGEITTNLFGKGELELEPHEGDTLPFDAASVLDLVGFGVSVNDVDGNPVLTGTVPAINDDCDDDAPPAPSGDGGEPPPGDGGQPPPDGGAAALVVVDPFALLGDFDAAFLRGDSNADQAVDMSDAISTLQFLFSGGLRPLCLDASDSNDDGSVDVSDPVFTLVHLFTGGFAHPEPGAFISGFDRTVDTLHCRESGGL